MGLKKVSFRPIIHLKALITDNVDVSAEYEKNLNVALQYNKVNNIFRPSLPFDVTRKLPINSRPTRIGRSISDKIKDDKSILDYFETKSEVQKYCSGLGCQDLASRGNLLINSGCGTGKTEAAIKIIELVQRRTLIITPRRQICMQWLSRIRNAHPNLKVGFDMIDPSYDISACTMEFVTKHDDVFKDVGLIVIDEAHMIVGSYYFIPILKALSVTNPPFCLALTATISFAETERYSAIKCGGRISNVVTNSHMYRRDVSKNKSFKSIFGPAIRFEDKHMKNIEINQVIAKFPTECKSDVKMTKFISCMKQVDLDVTDRYGLVLTNELVENANVAVILADHYNIPVEIIYDINVGCKTVQPGTSSDMIKTLPSHPYINRDCRIYVCTSCRASTGYDDPRLSWAIVLHNPGSNNVFIQTFGRIKRFTQTDNKKKFMFMPEFQYVTMKVKNEFKTMTRDEVLKGISTVNESEYMTLYRDKMCTVRPKILDELNVKTVLTV